jgi:hypothetical protein
VEKNKVVHRA